MPHFVLPGSWRPLPFFIPITDTPPVQLAKRGDDHPECSGICSRTWGVSATENTWGLFMDLYSCSMSNVPNNLQ